MTLEIQRIREQLLDTRTGKLIWRSVESIETDWQVREGELMRLPAVTAIDDQTMVVPYAGVDERRSWLKADVMPDLNTTLTTIVLRKVKLFVGPYVVTIWETGAAEDCACFRIQQAGCPRHG